MIIDAINLNHLRIFEVVFTTRSMTKAAEELHLTQSGVSQHIKALEGVLGIRLFDRIRKRVVPTPQAQILLQACNEGLTTIEEGLTQVRDGGTSLSGTLSIGMPPEFGNNLVVPLLTDLGKEHEGIRLNILFGFADDMLPRILSGEIDFAFLDAIVSDRRITMESVYNEILLLCANREFLEERGPVREDLEYLESLPYIEYLKGEEILRMWFRHHWRNRVPRLNVRATVMEAQGVARCVLAGLGAGILPSHLVIRLKKQGQRLHTFRGCGRPLHNIISLAYLKEKTHTPAVKAAMNQLRTALQKRTPRAPRFGGPAPVESPS